MIRFRAYLVSPVVHKFCQQTSKPFPRTLLALSVMAEADAVAAETSQTAWFSDMKANNSSKDKPANLVSYHTNIRVKSFPARRERIKEDSCARVQTRATSVPRFYLITALINPLLSRHQSAKFSAFVWLFWKQMKRRADENLPKKVESKRLLQRDAPINCFFCCSAERTKAKRKQRLPKKKKESN